MAVDIEAVRAAERDAERERIEEIGKMVRTVRLGDEFARKLVADGTSAKEASALIFGELARRDMETDTRSMHPVTSRGEDAAFVAGASDNSSRSSPRSVRAGGPPSGPTWRLPMKKRLLCSGLRLISGRRNSGWVTLRTSCSTV